ncbi:MAG: OmpA family protein [Deltaproteobacteria bacterium]
MKTGLITAVPYASAESARGAIDIYFDSNEDDFPPADEEALKLKIDELKNNPGLDIVVEGYSDITGEAEYNLGLSERRAQSVKRVLIDRGIESGRITASGRGKTDKFAGGLDEQSLRENRRVRIIIQTDQPVLPTPVTGIEDASPEGRETAAEEKEERVEETIEAVETVETVSEPLPPAVRDLATPPPGLAKNIRSVMRKLAPGRIIFEVPGKMGVGKTYIIEADFPYSFISDLSESIKENGTEGFNHFKLGRDVGVRLRGKEFDVRSLSDSSSAVDGGGQAMFEGLEIKEVSGEELSTKWAWTVTPLESGFQSLLLSVQIVLEDAEHNEVVNEHEIFEKVVEVNSSFIYSVTRSYLVMGVFIVIVVIGIGLILVKKFGVR